MHENSVLSGIKTADIILDNQQAGVFCTKGNQKHLRHKPFLNTGEDEVLYTNDLLITICMQNPR